MFLHNTPSVVLISFIAILGTLLSPIWGALILGLLTRVFKLKKQDFKTALYCSLIAFAALVTVSFPMSLLYFKVDETTMRIVNLVPLLFACIGGAYAIRHFYKLSFRKALLLSFLSGFVFLFILFIIIFVASLFLMG